jgi:hypothetical protein
MRGESLEMSCRMVSGKTSGGSYSPHGADIDSISRFGTVYAGQGVRAMRFGAPRHPLRPMVDPASSLHAARSNEKDDKVL